jgi:DNA-directed RNA polymerase III subunit RPC3
VRVHKILKLVADRDGDAASKLLSNVLQLGHASIGDLIAEYDLTAASKRDSGIDTAEHNVSEDGLLNGIAKANHATAASGKVATLSEFHLLTRSLLKKGYLVKVGERSYYSQNELQEQIKQSVIKRKFPDGKITGPKKSKEFRAAFNALKRKYEDEDAYKSSRDDASHGKIKSEKSTTSSNKRVKLNGDLPNGIHHSCSAMLIDSDHSVPKLPVFRCC